MSWGLLRWLVAKCYIALLTAFDDCEATDTVPRAASTKLCRLISIRPSRSAGRVSLVLISVAVTTDRQRPDGPAQFGI